MRFAPGSGTRGPSTKKHKVGPGEPASLDGRAEGQCWRTLVKRRTTATGLASDRGQGGGGTKARPCFEIQAQAWRRFSEPSDRPFKGRHSSAKDRQLMPPFLNRGGLAHLGRSKSVAATTKKATDSVTIRSSNHRP
jgi:hypothetical protein